MWGGGANHTPATSKFYKLRLFPRKPVTNHKSTMASHPRPGGLVSNSTRIQERYLHTPFHPSQSSLVPFLCSEPLSLMSLVTQSSCTMFQPPQLCTFPPGVSSRPPHGWVLLTVQVSATSPRRDFPSSIALHYYLLSSPESCWSLCHESLASHSSCYSVLV